MIAITIVIQEDDKAIHFTATTREQEYTNKESLLAGSLLRMFETLAPEMCEPLGKGKATMRCHELSAEQMKIADEKNRNRIKREGEAGA